MEYVSMEYVEMESIVYLESTRDCGRETWQDVEWRMFEESERAYKRERGVN